MLYTVSSGSEYSLLWDGSWMSKKKDIHLLHRQRIPTHRVITITIQCFINWWRSLHDEVVLELILRNKISSVATFFGFILSLFFFVFISIWKFNDSIEFGVQWNTYFISYVINDLQRLNILLSLFDVFIIKLNVFEGTHDWFMWNNFLNPFKSGLNSELISTTQSLSVFITCIIVL